MTIPRRPGYTSRSFLSRRRRPGAKRDAVAGAACYPLSAPRVQVRAAVGEGRMHELIAVAGQSAGLVRSVVPAGQIVRDIVDEAEQVLGDAGRLIS